jgi:hypothetical protein
MKVQATIKDYFSKYLLLEVGFPPKKHVRGKHVNDMNR